MAATETSTRPQRAWTPEEAAAVYPGYRMERARLLSNARCMRGLERRGFDTRPRMWHEPSSLLIKREIAELRSRWAGVRAALPTTGG